jgi:hypothetical protein
MRQKETPTEVLIQRATIVILHLYWVLLRVYTWCAFKSPYCSTIQAGIVKRSFKSYYGINLLLESFSTVNTVGRKITFSNHVLFTSVLDVTSPVDNLSSKPSSWSLSFLIRR